MYIFFIIMLFCLISVYLSENSILSIISLIGFFLNGTALLFFFRCEYLGIVYVVVYVGAIAVLFLFVVMMLDFKSSSSLYNLKTEYFFSSFIFLILFFVFIYIFFFKIFYYYFNIYLTSSFTYKNWVDYVELFMDINMMGYLIYSYYPLFLILSGFLLLIGMVGAIVLTLFKRENIKVQDLSDQVLRQYNSSIYLKSNK